MSKYIVVGFEKNRYEGGFAVKREADPWESFVATYPGASELAREQAQALADKLNEAGE